jgi:hypothetical protein
MINYKEIKNKPPLIKNNLNALDRNQHGPQIG